jgi:O-antigen/teichoic acid export membrane protein
VPEPIQTELKSRTLRGVRFTLASSIARMLLQSGTLVVMARLLGPAEYGVMAAALIIIQPLRTTLLSSAERAILLHQDMSDEAMSSAFFGLLGGSLLLSLVVIVCDIALVGSGTFKSVLALLSGMIILDCICSPARARLRYRMAFGIIGACELAAQIAGTVVVGILCAWNGLGTYSLAFAMLTQGAVQAILYWYFSGVRVTQHLNLGYIFAVARLTYHVARISFVSTVQGQFLFIFTWYFSGQVALGALNRAYFLMQLPTQILVNALTTVFFTGFALVREDSERLRTAMRSLVESSSIIIFPITMGMAAAAPQMVRVLLGKRWPAVEPLIPLLAAGTSFMMGGHLFSVMAEAVGRLRQKFIMQLSVTVVALFIYAVASRFGPIGSAFAFALSSGILFVGQLALASYILHSDLLRVLRWLVPGVASSALVAASVLCARALGGGTSAIGLLILEIIVSGITLVAALRLLFGATLYRLLRSGGLTFLTRYIGTVPMSDSP